jgi:hypothetical protein
MHTSVDFTAQRIELEATLPEPSQDYSCLLRRVCVPKCPLKSCRTPLHGIPGSGEIGDTARLLEKSGVDYARGYHGGPAPTLGRGPDAGVGRRSFGLSGSGRCATRRPADQLRPGHRRRWRLRGGDAGRVPRGTSGPKASRFESPGTPPGLRSAPGSPVSLGLRVWRGTAADVDEALDLVAVGSGSLVVARGDGRGGLAGAGESHKA